MKSPKTRILFQVLSGLALTTGLLACQPPAGFVNNRQPLGLTAQPVYNASARELQIRISLPFEPEFRTQAIQCSSITSFRVSVSGLGIETPILPTSPVPDASGRINGSNCEVFASFSNLPSGPGRVISIEGYDSNGNAVAGARIKGLVDLSPLGPNPSPSPNGPTTGAEVSQRTTPAAEVVEHLISSHGAKGRQVLGKLSTSGLKSFVDSITGAVMQSASPLSYSYVIHPTLLRPDQIAADLVSADGNLAQLSSSNRLYRLASGSISGNILGIASGDQLEIRVHDPLSQRLDQTAGSASEPFSLSGIAPGNWLLEVKNITAGTVRTQLVSSSATGLTINFSVAPSSNWTELDGPLGGSVHAMARETGFPDLAFAATSHGVYKSTNATTGAGMSWNLAGLPEREFLSVFVKDSSTIYAGTRSHGLYKSTDSGASWNAVIDSDLTGKSVYRLVLAGGNLYAATSGGVLIQGAGPGFDWSQAGAQPPSSEEVRDLVFNGSHLLATLAGGSNAGVYLASVPVTGWSSITENLSAGTVGPLTVSGTGTSNRVVAGTDGQAYGCNLINSPSCWSAGSSVAAGPVFLMRYLSGPDLYLAASGGSAIQQSTPDGSYGLPTTWSEVGAAPPASEPLNNPIALGFDSGNLTGSGLEGVLGLTDGGGISELVNSGNLVWQTRNQGLEASTVKDLVHLSGSILFAATSGGGIWRYSGSNWGPLLNTPLNGGKERYVQALAVDSNGNAYAAVKNQIYVLSEASGNTVWSLFSSGLPATAEVNDLHVANGFVYAAVTNVADQGLYKSCAYDSGACAGGSWTVKYSAQPVTAVADHPQIPGQVLLGTTDGHVWKSSDHGETWPTDLGALVSGSIGQMAIGSTGLSGNLYVSSKSASAELKRYELSDSVLSDVSPGLSDEILSLAVDRANPDKVAIGTRASGVRYTVNATDQPPTWHVYNGGTTTVSLDRLPVTALAFDASGTLYAGTEGRGVYQDGGVK